MPFGNLNQHRIVAALSIVVLFQFQSQPVALNPNNRVYLRVEVLLSTQSLDSDRVLLQDVVGASSCLRRQEL